MRKVKKRKKHTKLMLFTFIIITLFSIGFTFAKYIDNKENSILYEASAFYLESNYLSNIDNTKSYTIEKGIDEITFTIQNNIDTLRYSTVSINYTVSISDIEGKSVKDKAENTISNINGSLQKGSVKSNTHTFNNLKDGVYVVTATSTKPYSKTIKANFIITNSSTNIETRITDMTDSPILQLIINSNDYEGNITITWPEGITPDNTNPLFANVGTGYTSASKVMPVSKNAEYIVQFFKEDPAQTYQISDFEVGVSS